MSNWWSFGSNSNANKGSAYLPDIFPMPIAQTEFVRTDVVQTYSKILSEVVERCQGITDEIAGQLFDNCLASEAGKGLITLLAEAMQSKGDLCLVYKSKVLRKADTQEAIQIRADYKEKGSSEIGVFISFANYTKSDMVNLYSGLEHCTVSALNKGLNLSKAVIYKVNDLRASVALIDSSKAEEQVQKLATALSKGKDGYCDAKDVVEMLKPDLNATKEAIAFLDSKRCFYLGLPRSWVNGELEGGLGSSGNGDAKAIARGLKGGISFRSLSPR